MSNTETLNKAIELLKSINCPEPILDALCLFSFIVYNDDLKLKNWNAWGKGQLVEGQADEIETAITPRLPVPEPKNKLRNCAITQLYFT